MNQNKALKMLIKWFIYPSRTDGTFNSNYVLVNNVLFDKIAKKSKVFLT